MGKRNAVDKSLQAVREKNDWFDGRSLPFKHAMLGLGRTVSFQAGQFIFRRGDPNCGVYVVLSGAVKVSGIAENGKESILTVLETAEWFGELALFDGQHRTHDAQADQGTTLLHIPYAALEDVLNDQPQFWKDFGLLMSQKLRAVFVLLEDTALLSVSERLVKRLQLIVESSATVGEASAVLNLDQSSLASMLACSRQTVNQVLKHLEQEGLLVVSYGEIQIPNVQRLKTYL